MSNAEILTNDGNTFKEAGNALLMETRNIKNNLETNTVEGIEFAKAVDNVMGMSSPVLATGEIYLDVATELENVQDINIENNKGMIA